MIETAARTDRTVRRETVAGALLVLAGVVALMGIISAETFYPDYSTAANAISDLGATVPPNSVIHQPSATIFNLTMLATGLLVLGATGALSRSRFGLQVIAPLAAFGLGAFLVGVFPGNWGTIHALAAMLTFIGGGVSAVASATALRPPLRYISAGLGLVSLLTLLSYFVLGAASPMAVFGMGGLERWIAYPVLLYVLAFGGYLMGDAPERARV